MNSTSRMPPERLSDRRKSGGMTVTRLLDRLVDSTAWTQTEKDRRDAFRQTVAEFLDDHGFDIWEALDDRNKEPDQR